MDAFIPAAPISPLRQRRPISKALITAPTKPSLVPADPMGTAAKAPKPASMPAAAQRPHSLPSAPRVRSSATFVRLAAANTLHDYGPTTLEQTVQKSIFTTKASAREHSEIGAFPYENERLLSRALAKLLNDADGREAAHGSLVA